MFCNREGFQSRKSNEYAFFVGEIRNFFINIVETSWNRKPSNFINSSSLNGFKCLRQVHGKTANKASIYLLLKNVGTY